MRERKMRTRASAFICVTLAVLAVLALLAGCSGSSNKDSGNGTRTFTDSCGRSVEIPSNVEKVAAASNIGQQVMLAFAPDMLVGLATEIDDSQAKYIGSEYAKLPVFGQLYGGKGSLNKEALAAAEPQLIIDIGESKDSIAADMDALQEQLGIPCVHIEATLDTYDQTFAMLGDLLGREDRGKELSEYCAEVYSGISDKMATIPEGQRVRGVYVTGEDGQSVIASGSIHANILDMVIDNVAVVDNPASKGTGNEVGVEQIAVWNPDLIIFAAGSIYGSVGSNAAWKGISAIESGNYYEAPGEPYNWVAVPPSINQVLGLQWLARVCYPDKFDDDMQEVVTEYYKLFYDYDLSDSDYSELTANALK